jgi:hypothetical protein
VIDERGFVHHAANREHRHEANHQNDRRGGERRADPV